MIHHFVKLVIEVVGGIAAAVAVNEATRYFTGKSALEHLSDAAGPLRDDIAAWCHRNADRQVSAIVLRLVKGVDNTLSGLARVKVIAFAKTKEGEVKVTEKEITAAESRQMFGDKLEISIL
jgi:hypothetical protein